jgi:hypothetical protein
LDILLRTQTEQTPKMDKFFVLYGEWPSFISYADWRGFIISTPGPSGIFDLDEKVLSEYISNLVKELQGR